MRNRNAASNILKSCQQRHERQKMDGVVSAAAGVRKRAPLLTQLQRASTLKITQGNSKGIESPAKFRHKEKGVFSKHAKDQKRLCSHR